MKTPKEYSRLIKEGIITPQMLSDCLYSANKRAKNYRDKEMYQRDRGKYNPYWFDKFDNEKKYRDLKEEYYRKKDRMLSIVEPTCIHREDQIEKVRYYDYEDYFYQINESEKVVHSGEYFDRETGEYVQFVDLYEKTGDRYYLYYDLGYGHSFHKPIQSPDNYQLPIVDIESLKTYGSNTDDLISAQFVDKVINLIESNQYTYAAAVVA